MYRFGIITFFLFAGFSLSLYSQGRDNIWMLGSYPFQQNYGLKFDAGIADTFAVIREMQFLADNASICDTTGNLLFYSNGVYVANNNHDTLLNSTDFNPGYFTDYYGNQGDGLGIYNGLVILPRPGYQKNYFIIHESAENFIWDSVMVSHPLNLSFSEIDMDLDGGLGGIIPGRKSIHLIDDTLTIGRVAAVKHGNGRDWWVLVHRFNSNEYLRLLITPDTVIGPLLQSIGSHNPSINYVGQSVFSRDGSKFCFQISELLVEEYDFDRCTGLLSNPSPITINDSSYTLMGLAFSPNGRYLYACNNVFIHQFDTWSGNIPGSDIIVAQWDTFYSPGPTVFNTMQLASDGRVYVNTYVGTNMLHYIENPDSAGANCNVVQNNFLTPSYNTFSFPNSPNWDLESAFGSGCDTLDLRVNGQGKSQYQFEIMPNPTSDFFLLTFELPFQMNASLIISTQVGQIEKIVQLNRNEKTIRVQTSGFKQGIYIYQIANETSIIGEGKIVVIH